MFHFQCSLFNKQNKRYLWFCGWYKKKNKTKPNGMLFKWQTHYCCWTGFVVELFQMQIFWSRQCFLETTDNLNCIYLRLWIITMNCSLSPALIRGREKKLDFIPAYLLFIQMNCFWFETVIFFHFPQLNCSVNNKQDI